jgi:hypothetical protein
MGLVLYRQNGIRFRPIEHSYFGDNFQAEIAIRICPDPVQFCASSRSFLRRFMVLSIALLLEDAPMAAQISETDHAIPAQYEINVYCDAECESDEPCGGAMRGFFFVMLFDVFMIFTAAAAWEVWHLMR